MNKVISTGLVLGAVLSLIGCGGGSGDPKTVTKVIMDDPIVGLNYKCTPSGKKDKTNEKGEFTCNVGDRVKFSIGKYVIGSTDTSSGTADTLRIIDLIEDEAKVTDVRQILQTIDSTDDGVITIPAGFAVLDDLDAEPGDKDFDEQAKGLLDGLLAGEDADRHAEESYQKYLLAGKTFYFVNHKHSYPVLMEVRFFDDFSKAVFYKDSKNVGENKLEINGTKVTLLKGEKDDPYIIFTAEEEGGHIVAHAVKSGTKFDMVYYDTLDEAKNQFDAETATTSLTEEMLEGKIFYKSRYETPAGSSKKVTVFQAAKYTFPSVSKIEMFECPCSESGVVTDAYSQTVAIKDGKLKITTNHHGIYYISLHEIEGDAWNVFYEGDTNSDGVIDKRGTQIWYTIKPEGFPEFSAFSGGGEGSSPEAHFVELFASKTFYAVEVGDDHLDVVTVNADLTKMTIKEGDEPEFNIDLEAKGDKLILGAAADNTYATVEAEMDEYILIKFFENNKYDDSKRLYFDKAKAKAYADGNAIRK